MVSAYMIHSLPMETFGTLETVAGPKSFSRMRNAKTRTFLITKKSQQQGEEGRGLWIYDERVNVRFCECFVGRGMEIRSDSLLIIILKTVELMLPTQQASFQPYFVFQAMPEQYPQFFTQNVWPFALSNFYAQDQVSRQVLNRHAIERREPISLIQQIGGQRQKSRDNSTSDQHSNQEVIKKEKLIRKLANRPATYLTERKYYLAQNLPDQSQEGRQLRTRVNKKKVRSNCRTQQKNEQNPLISTPSKAALPLNELNKDLNQNEGSERPALPSVLEHQDHEVVSCEKRSKNEKRSLQEEAGIQKIEK